MSGLGSVKHDLHSQLLFGMFHVLPTLVYQKEDHPMRQTTPNAATLTIPTQQIQKEAHAQSDAALSASGPTGICNV